MLDLELTSILRNKPTIKTEDTLIVAVQTVTDAVLIYDNGKKDKCKKDKEGIRITKMDSLNKEQEVGCINKSLIGFIVWQMPPKGQDKSKKYVLLYFLVFHVVYLLTGHF